MRISKQTPGVKTCSGRGFAYIADSPERGYYWGFKGGKYYKVSAHDYYEVDKHGKRVRT